MFTYLIGPGAVAALSLHQKRIMQAQTEQRPPEEITSKPDRPIPATPGLMRRNLETIHLFCGRIDNKTSLPPEAK